MSCVCVCVLLYCILGLCSCTRFPTDRIAVGLGLQIGLWRVGAGVVACRAYIFHIIPVGVVPRISHKSDLFEFELQLCLFWLVVAS